MKDQCETCRFWWQKCTEPENEDDGECRKSQPSRDSNTGRGVWATTKSDDGCGDHEEGYDNEPD